MPQPPAERAQELADLLSRTALGDRQAFARLYERTSAHLLGVILRIQRRHDLAEDLLQEVYVSLWRHAGSFDAQRAQALTWMSSVARHRAIDSLRRLHTQPQTLSSHRAGHDEEDDHDMLQDFASADPDPQDLLDSAVQARAMQTCLGTLNADQKQSLALAFYQGLTHAEVAEHLKQPLGSVKSWVRRGLQALRGCLERAGLGDAAVVRMPVSKA
ncbi:RNA polymerase sigma-70 factor (ECF subfamily) [Sphaerotilus hippei]|uniref:RNA polymerase sigma-70 factor (ECF subfamily) n=1 Tax=Sphaerotilus hippei TaxID=744406 RepID=A0A318H100_9BURK|nr:sigma-70 family RNA polymerase sigma factor [Sphaerotilus hippei]PXW96544.1 RNA polymerase sigma-70 factor (ECF subfamily) [Sphaerotilus hippei]